MKILKFLPHWGLILSLAMLWGASKTTGVVNLALVSTALIPWFMALDRPLSWLQSIFMRIGYVALFFAPVLGFYYNILQYKPVGFAFFLILLTLIMVDNRFYTFKLLKENLKKISLFWEIVLVVFLFWCRDLFSYTVLFNETFGYFFSPDQPFMAAVVPVIGVSGLTLWMVSFNYGIYRFLQTLKPCTLLPAIAIAGLFFYLPAKKVANPVHTKVLVMQPNLVLKDYNGNYLHPEKKYTADFFNYWDSNLAKHEKEIFDVVIAPELTFVYPLLNPQTVEQQKAVDQLKQRVMKVKKPLIIGSYYVDSNNQRANAFYVLSPTETGVKITMGSKQDLLPYLEGEDLFRLSSIMQGQTLFGSVGSNVVDFNGLKAVSAICYETMRTFSSYKSVVMERASLLLNLTDESDFSPKTVEHFSERTSYRALELGIPVLRVSKSGFSALKNERGETVESLKAGADSAVWTVATSLSSEPSIYGKYQLFYALLFSFYAFFVLFLFGALLARKNPFIL